MFKTVITPIGSQIKSPKPKIKTGIKKPVLSRLPMIKKPKIQIKL